MKTTKNLLAAVALSVGLLSASAANANLIAADGGLTVYDADANLYWLANANVNGTMTWNGAQSWITSLNTANYLGYNDWRLPTTLQPDPSCSNQSGGVSWGYNCTGSEMGNLFYNELGGVADSSILTTHNADLALFNNVQTGYYWSGTEYAPDTSYAWVFRTGYGGQYVGDKSSTLFVALAVRDGQVVSAVPEPETYAMLLVGLGLIGFMARRREGRNV